MIKVGTDFSGIGSPEQALKDLGIEHEVIFSCEIDKYARLSYENLHGVGKVYEDITKRNHDEVEQLDLYVAGFPCQAFSMAGKRQGFSDEQFYKAQAVNSDTQLYKQAGNTISVNVIRKIINQVIPHL